jgi:ATP-binding cassette subfamily B protein
MAPWRRLLTMATNEWRLLLPAMLALAVGSALSLAWPQAVRHLVDGLADPQRPLDRFAIGGLLALFGVQGVASGLRAFWFTVAGERVVARLRADLYDALLHQPIAFFDASRTGELLSRLGNDATVLQNTVTANVSMALRFGAGAVGGIALLAWTSPLLTGVALAVVPAVAVGGSLYGRAVRGLSTELQDALARSTELAEETLGGIRTVRAFAQEPDALGRYRGALGDALARARRLAMAVGLFNGFGGFAGQGALALIVWFGAGMVRAGTLSLGDLTAFLLYTALVAFSLGALAGLYGDFMRAVGASERIFALLDRARGIEAAGGARPEVARGAVRFDAVHFAYPSRPDVVVLKGVSLELAEGETVAVVGPSGSGKSTLAALLSRFYDPDAGAVRFDGRDLTELDPAWLRRRVGVVAQEPVLFATSIAENIRYGRPDASDDELFAAARAAHADAFVRAFPDGYGTAVGERGVRLSGGQKQRIAIARALLQDPRVLVLDEATSALDAESEHLVQEALDRLMVGRTVLVIAHRLSTVRGADRVVVLDGGTIVETGSHDALMSADGAYRRLVERQFA